MTSTILHLEDDAELRELVQMLFDSCGFRGKHVPAGTLADAVKLLDENARQGCDLDLVISDMNLPDGTGLDLIRHVRANAAWKSTPMLILSGDLDPNKVRHAYALGADAYVDKAAPGRLLADVVTTMYAHWAANPMVDPGPGTGRIQHFLAKAYNHRGRHAGIYRRFASAFAGDPGESTFWLSLALYELNATNLIAFLQRNLSEDDIPSSFVEKMDRGADLVEARLTLVERELDRSAVTRPHAYSLVIDLLSAMSLDGLALSIDHLCAGMPEPMEASRDFLTNMIRDVVAWVDANTDDAELHTRVALLRGKVAAAFATGVSRRGTDPNGSGASPSSSP